MSFGRRAERMDRKDGQKRRTERSDRRNKKMSNNEVKTMTSVLKTAIIPSKGDYGVNFIHSHPLCTEFVYNFE